ncbi:hypothetical protein DV736_g2182, partial [Chaetothyriales sp. CBS 134916]
MKLKNGQRSKQKLTDDAMQVWVNVPSTVDFVHAENDTADAATATKNGEKNDIDTSPALPEPEQPHGKPTIAHRDLGDYHTADKWHTSPGNALQLAIVSGDDHHQDATGH